jgi:hypothetical protein
MYSARQDIFHLYIRNVSSYRYYIGRVKFLVARNCSYLKEGLLKTRNSIYLANRKFGDTFQLFGRKKNVRMAVEVV